jgi:uncharacterized protein
MNGVRGSGAGREVLHLRRSDARRVPWKNGRGVTEELALWPANASFEDGRLDWRISKAKVEAAGPFSCFPGCERILVVTRGEGLVLSHPESSKRRRLRSLEPYRFSGDEATEAELDARPVEDFNVIVARERASADVEVLRLARRHALLELSPGHAFLHLSAGKLVARVTGEEEPFALAAGESLWVRAALDLELDLSGKSEDCRALLVRVGAPRG